MWSQFTGYWSSLFLIVLTGCLSGCSVSPTNLTVPGPDGLVNFRTPSPSSKLSLPSMPVTQPQLPVAKPPSPIPQPIIPEYLPKQIILTTSKGDITIELYVEFAPTTVNRFVQKIQSHFYEGLTFHRVEDWVVQGGDPLGNGSGGESVSAEYNQIPFTPGSVGVARGEDPQINNGSQFFICLDNCSHLTGIYTNFGRVISSLSVVKSIQVGDKILSIEIVE